MRGACVGVKVISVAELGMAIISFKTTIKLSFTSFDYCIEHELGIQFPLALTY